MDAHVVAIPADALVGFGLWVASEALALSPLRSNSIAEFVMAVARRAFPYEPRRQAPPANLLQILMGRGANRDGRRRW